MSHFAKVLDNKVVQVIVAEPDFIQTLVDATGDEWVQTSFNTEGNQHKLGGTPLRGNYAGIGYTYDKTNDVFYAPQPYPSWVLNNSTWLWEAPTANPADGKAYIWDEPSLNWIEI